MAGFNDGRGKELAYVETQADGGKAVVDNAGEIVGLTTAELAALRAGYLQRPPSLDELLAEGPVHLAHSGFGFMAPAYYRPAYRAASRLHRRIRPDGGNFLVASGMLVDSHNANGEDLLNGAAWTDFVGAISTMTPAQIAAVRVKGGAYFGYGWGDQLGLTTMEQFLGATDWGVTAPEPKSVAAADEMAKQLAALGMQPWSLVNASFDGTSTARLAQFGPRGFKHVAYTLSAGEHASINTALCNTLKAAGVTWINVDGQQASAVSAATTAVANGLRLMVWNIWRLSHMAKFSGVPVEVWASDEPIYTFGDPSLYRVSVLDFSKATITPGFLASTDSPLAVDRGAFNGDAGWTMTPPTSTIRMNLLGSLCPLPNASGSYKVTVPFDILALNTGVDARWGLEVAITPTDKAFSENAGAQDTGIVALVRHSAATNGTGAAGSRIKSWVSGVETINSAPTSPANPWAAGNSGTLIFTITPDTVGLEVTGSQPSPAWSIPKPTTHNGSAFLHVGVGANAAGSSIRIRSVTVTPL